MLHVPNLDLVKIDVKVTDVRTVQNFAGKFGYRVSTTLVVEHDGRSYTISIPAYHTRMGGRQVRTYQAGETLSTPRSGLHEIH